MVRMTVSVSSASASVVGLNTMAAVEDPARKVRVPVRGA